MKFSHLGDFFRPRNVHGLLSCTQFHAWNSNPSKSLRKSFVIMHGNSIYMLENDIFMDGIFKHEPFMPRFFHT